MRDTRQIQEPSLGQQLSTSSHSFGDFSKRFSRNYTAQQNES